MCAAGVRMQTLWGDRYYAGPASGPTANWNTSGNWSANDGGGGQPGVPGAADIAFIKHSDTTDRNITFDTNSTIAGFNVGNTGTGTSTLSQSLVFNLTVPRESLGFLANSHAAHVQSAGSNTYSSGLSVGDLAGSAGRYDLSVVGVMNVSGTAGGATGLDVGQSVAGT